MVALGKCFSCRPSVFGYEPVHCYGKGDQPAPPGVMGGFRCVCDCRVAAHNVQPPKAQNPEHSDGSECARES